MVSFKEENTSMQFHVTSSPCSQLGQDKKLIRQIDDLEVYLKYRPVFVKHVYILSNLTGKVSFLCAKIAEILCSTRPVSGCQGCAYPGRLRKILHLSPRVEARNWRVGG